MNQKLNAANLGRVAAICLALVFRLGSGPVFAEAEVPRSGGIWHSRTAQRTFSAEEQDVLVASLRRITGFEELDFDIDGSLIVGDVTRCSGGSRLARELLTKALSSGAVFILEDHSKSPIVRFGQIDEGTDYWDRTTGRRTMIWKVRIDPTDFRGIEAPFAVRASFDEGFTVMHELLHGLGYDDALKPGDIGECESLLNEIRTDLGLPIRAEYFATYFPITRALGTVRLRFQRHRFDGRRTRTTDAYLYFTASSEILTETPLSCWIRAL